MYKAYAANLLWTWHHCSFYTVPDVDIKSKQTNFQCIKKKFSSLKDGSANKMNEIYTLHIASCDAITTFLSTHTQKQNCGFSATNSIIYIYIWPIHFLLFVQLEKVTRTQPSFDVHLWQRSQQQCTLITWVTWCFFAHAPPPPPLPQ